MPRKKKKRHVYRLHKKSKLEKALIFAQLMRFFREEVRNDPSFTKSEVLLFYAIIQEFDNAGWLDRIRITNATISRHMRTTNRQSIMKARKGLEKRGLIRCDHGVKNVNNVVYFYLDIMEGLVADEYKKIETEI